MRDLDNEQVLLRDQFGETRLDPKDLPGKVLTLCMLDGLALRLKQAPNARSAWIEMKAGLLPRHLQPSRIRNRPKPPPKDRPPRPLCITRQAIVAALLDNRQCESTYAEAESVVREMSKQQVALWGKEPEVQMHLRRIRGETVSRIDELLADLTPKPPKR